MEITGDPLRVLFFTERPEKAEKLEDDLKEMLVNFESRTVHRESDYLKIIQKFKPDVVLSDECVQKYTMQEAMEDLRRSDPFSAFILLEKERHNSANVDQYLQSGIDDILYETSAMSLSTSILRTMYKKQAEKSSFITRQVLRDNELQLRSLFNFDEHAIFLVDFRNNIQDLNPSAKKWLSDLKDYEVIGASFLEFVHRNDVKTFRTAHAAVFRGKNQHIEISLQSHRNMVRQVSMSLTPIKTNEEGVKSIMLLCKDNTQEFLLKKKFRLSEDRFNGLTKSVPVVVFYTDLFGNCQYVNERWYEFTGYKEQDALGKGWISIVHPDDRDQVIKAWDELIEGKKDFELKYRFNTRNDAVLWVYGNAVPVFDPDNHLEGFIGTITDLTNDREQQVVRDQAYKRLEGAMKLSKLAEWEHELRDLSGRWSGRMFEIYQRNPELGVPDFEESLQFVHPDDRQKVFDFRMASKSSVEPVDLSYRIITTQGEIRYLTETVACEFNHENKPLLIRGIVKDETDEKNRVDDLLINKLKLDVAQDIANIGIWELDVVSRKSTWSNNLHALLDQSEKFKTPDEFFQRIHPEDRDRVTEHYIQLRNHLKRVNGEFRYLLPDGTLRYINYRSQLVKLADGRPMKLIAVLLDVSEERKREFEVWGSKNRLSLAASMTGLADWQMDLTTRKVFWSDEMYRIFEIPTVDGPLSEEEFLEAIHPDDRDRARQNFERLLADDSLEIRDHSRVILKNGKVKYLSFAARYEFDLEGNPVRLIGAVLDLSFVASQFSATQG